MSLIEKLELLRARADAAHKYADVSAAYEACGIAAEIGPAIRQAMIDAERYRWLRDASSYAADKTPTVYDCRIPRYEPSSPRRILDGDELDAAIDTARATGEGEGNG